MKTVYFVRHGESHINIEGDATIIDESSPLSADGRKQAEAVARRCAKLRVELIVASPQVRARETAEFIAKETMLPLTYSEFFIERQIPSALLGKPRGRIRDALETWNKSFFVEGQTFNALCARAGNALSYLYDRPESSILVVTHGFLMRTILARLIFGDTLTPNELKKFMKATRTDNTGITVLTYGAVPRHAVDPHEARWMIRVFNDHAHLG